MSAASEISTVRTVWPLMSMPRMSRALASASSAVGANFTPPALPRPPALTCALTITGPPSCSAAALACSTDVTTTCGVTGTSYFANSSLACHSNRSTTGEAIRRGSGGVSRTDVLADPLDESDRRGPRGEDLRDAHLLQRRDVGVRDDAAAEHDDVERIPLAKQLEHAAEQRHVRPGEDGQADRVRVLLQRGLDDLLGSLVQPRVDDLHAGVAQCACDDLGPAVVAVEARLRDDHANPRPAAGRRRHREPPSTSSVGCCESNRL